MFNIADLEPKDALEGLLPAYGWLHLHDYKPPDLLPGARIHLVNDHNREVQRIYIAPIQQKARLDVLTHQMIVMSKILYKELAMERLQSCDVKVSPRGDFAFLQMPFTNVRPLQTFDNFKTNHMVHFVSDLSALLIWIHRQPINTTLDFEEAEIYKHEDVLWRIAAEHPPCRSSVNKMIQLAAYAMSTRRPIKRQLTFAASRVNSLWENKRHRLQCSYPPLLVNGNPWRDLIRHVLLFNGNHLGWRDALINIYFNMQVPIAFFSHLLLEELNALCYTFETQTDFAIVIETLELLAAQYGANSIVPHWYEQPRFSIDTDTFC